MLDPPSQKLKPGLGSHLFFQTAQLSVGVSRKGSMANRAEMINSRAPTPRTYSAQETRSESS